MDYRTVEQSSNHSSNVLLNAIYSCLIRKQFRSIAQPQRRLFFDIFKRYSSLRRSLILLFWSTLYVLMSCALCTNYTLTLVHHFLSSENWKLPHLFIFLMILLPFCRLLSGTGSNPILLDLLCFFSGSDHEFSYTCSRCLKSQTLLRLGRVPRKWLSLLRLSCCDWLALILAYWLLYECITCGFINAQSTGYLVLGLI